MTGEVIELRLGSPGHGGICVARSEGRVIMVRHGIPGELVRAQVVAKRSRVWFADVIEVLEPSPDRVPQIWPEAGPGGIGGAELGHLRYGAQPGFKTEVLAQTLRRIGGEGFVAALPGGQAPQVQALPGDGLRSRTRVEFVISEQGRPAMYEFRSKTLHELNDLPLATQGIQDLNLLTDEHWRKIWQPGQRVRAVEPEHGPAVVVTPDGVFTPTRKRRAEETLKRIVPQEGTDLQYRVPAGGFWQSHPLAGQTLIAAVLASGISPGERVLELFGGSGLFTVPVARRIGPQGVLVSIDGVPEATTVAKANLRKDPLVSRELRVNARIETGHIDPKLVAELMEERPLNGRCDTVLLDPPRAGAGLPTMRAITDADVDRVVLVACDPAAFARDGSELCRCGLRPVSVQAFDLFPHTHHFEIVAVFER